MRLGTSIIVRQLPAPRDRRPGPEGFGFGRSPFQREAGGRKSHAHVLLAFAALVLLQAGYIPPAYGQGIATIPEIFRTQDWPGVEVDSVAAWGAPDGSALLFVTAKAVDQIFVCDGITGKQIKTIGGPGSALGQFRRPNGIAVVDDFLFVVERENRTVQVFQIPSLKPITFFGEEVLLTPYGLTAFRSKEGYELYVTDDYPLRRTGRRTRVSVPARVKHFQVRKAAGGFDVRLVRMFGDTTGKAALQKVESILADPGRNRLYVCDETANDVKVFDLEGRYLETVCGDAIRYEPEGLVVFEDTSAPTGGWLALADQSTSQTVLRVFTRDGRRHLGDVIAKPNLANTDGIALLPGNLGPFEKGALYCVHNDKRVHAYSWADVLKAIGTRSVGIPDGETTGDARPK